MAGEGEHRSCDKVTVKQSLRDVGRVQRPWGGQGLGRRTGTAGALKTGSRRRPAWSRDVVSRDRDRQGRSWRAEERGVAGREGQDSGCCAGAPTGSPKRTGPGSEGGPPGGAGVPAGGEGWEMRCWLSGWQTCDVWTPRERRADRGSGAEDGAHRGWCCGHGHASHRCPRKPTATGRREPASSRRCPLCTWMLAGSCCPLQLCPPSPWAWREPSSQTGPHPWPRLCSPSPGGRPPRPPVPPALGAPLLRPSLRSPRRCE